MTDAVLFDLMGALLVQDPASAADPGAHFHRVARDAGVDLDRQAFFALLRDTPPRATRDRTPFEDRLVRLCAAAGVDMDLQQARRMAAEVCGVSNRVLRLDPEALEALAAARRRGPVALVTNYDHPPNIHRLLEREALGPQFDAVVISGEIGIWKPDPGILRAALHELAGDGPAIDAGRAVYVGDSAIDVQAAHAAGVHAILIRRDGDPSDPLRDPHAEEAQVDPDVVISRLSELDAALARLDTAT